MIISDYDSKDLFIDVNLNEEYPVAVQTMLENLYDDKGMKFDEVDLDGTDRVWSKKYYKGLYYGTISEEDWDRIREMENSGFELDCIFAIVIEINNPSMVYLSSDKSFINLQKMYGLKLKFCFVRDAEYGADKTKKEHQKKLVMTMPF